MFEQRWRVRERKKEGGGGKGKREKETKGTWKGKCIRTGGGTKYECRGEGCGGWPMSTTKAIVRHLLNSSSLPRFYPAISSVREGREREGGEKEKATRATRCKTLPVNFIALGTFSYTSTCTTRHLTYLHPARNHHPPFNPSAFAYTLGRESDRGNIQTYANAHNRTHRTRTGLYIVVIACVHTGRTAARVFTTDGG